MITEIHEFPWESPNPIQLKNQLAPAKNFTFSISRLNGSRREVAVAAAPASPSSKSTSQSPYIQETVEWVGESFSARQREKQLLMDGKKSSCVSIRFGNIILFSANGIINVELIKNNGTSACEFELRNYCLRRAFIRDSQWYDLCGVM